MSQPSHSTDIQPALNYLYGLQRLGIKLGLEHTERLLSACGNPHKNFRSIHIAGTNGKGSTAKFIASILQEAGYKTGLYTSPHLVAFNERISINGNGIHDEDIALFISEYKDAITDIDSTFFETTTAMAFWYFSKNHTDAAVVETGMGGRLDSTNVLIPDASVITSVGFDHCERLGNTLKDIAREKAGIIKQNVPVFSSRQNAEAIKEIVKTAEKENAPLTVADEVFRDENEINSFTYRDKQYAVSLAGKHQTNNAALAVDTVTSFDSEISQSNIRNGLQKTVWRGRMEKVSANPDCYYDVAHNPESIDAVLKTIESLYETPPIGVMVLKEGKDIALIAEKIKSRFSTLIVSAVPGLGLFTSEELACQLREYGIDADGEPNFSSAMEKGKDLVSDSRCLLIFGSHYVAGEIYNTFDFSFGEEAK